MSINDTLSGIDTSGVSVVIPTLGGESLFKTVDYLNEGSMIPDEILVCIPDDQFYRAESLSHENVRVIKTTFYGQVAQRATGFQQAKTPGFFSWMMIYYWLRIVLKIYLYMQRHMIIPQLDQNCSIKRQVNIIRI